MRNKRTVLNAIGLGISCILMAGTLMAQGSTATIEGTVTDASGAAVVGAMVEVKNTDTGVAQSTQTGAQGRYRVPDLSIGKYDVQATQTGFQPVVHQGITLNVGSESVVDFSLPVLERR